VVALFGAFTSGMTVVQGARENTRATQIMVQKMETIRLLTWNQGINSSIARPAFEALYDPASTNAGTVYEGSYEYQPADTNIPAAYRDKLRKVNVTIYWTNHVGGRARVQSRQMETFVARYGMQNYVIQ
jgi:hypothetical protein